MKTRDIIAVPFWALAIILDYLAISIGGKWTAKMYAKYVRKITQP